MLTVQISEKGGKQARHEFEKSRISIGRMKKNDIVLPRGNVSKKHAALHYKGGNLQVEDLDSTNGTYVNGRKIENKRDISPDDKIYIGDFILKVSPAEKTTPSSPQQKAEDDEQSTIDTSGQEDDAPEVDLNSLEFDEDNRQNRKTIGEQRAEVELKDPESKTDETPESPSTDSEDESTAQSSDSRSTTPEQDLRKTPSRSFPRSHSEPIVDEFDESLHKRQHRAAKQLLRELTIDELSLERSTRSALEDDTLDLIEEAAEEASYGTDEKEVRTLLESECAGLGVLQEYLEDDAVQQIHVHRFDYILLKKGSQLTVAPKAFSHPEFLLLAIQRLVGTRDFESGKISIRLDDGARCEILTPLITQNEPVASIRKPISDFPTLSALVERNGLSPKMSEFLTKTVQSGRSMLISGTEELTRTQFLNAVARTIPENERIVFVEEFSQLSIARDTTISLETNPDQQIDLAYLVNTAIDLCPDRILLDGCAHAEAYQWVTAAATTTQGSMVTIRGTHAADALGRLENLCMLKSDHLSPRGIREQIVSALDVVVSLGQRGTDDFQVNQITEIQGLDLDRFRLNDIFHYNQDGDFTPTGYIPMFYEDLEQAGWDVNFDIFND